MQKKYLKKNPNSHQMTKWTINPAVPDPQKNPEHLMTLRQIHNNKTLQPPSLADAF